MTPFVAPLSGDEKPDPRTNWAGNVHYSTDNLYRPETVEQVQETVRKCSKIRGLGTRHSFNRIADSRNNQISVRALNKIVGIDGQAKTVTVEGGISYGQLCPQLHEGGYALHNLASLPHISVAGACATGTHGSGVKNGNLSTAARAIEFVKADGELSRFRGIKMAVNLQGAVVGLGGLGIVTKIVSIFSLLLHEASRFRHMPLSELSANFDAIEASGYSVSLFTDWTTSDDQSGLDQEPGGKGIPRPSRRCSTEQSRRPEIASPGESFGRELH